MTECFRRRVIRFFLDRELITKAFASNLLSWKNSGFSIDASLRLYGSDDKTRESIAQYLVRPPLSLSKITYESFKGKVLFKTKYNEYFGENFKVYNGEDFVSALAQHIPPARVHLVRYYGLYSSRGRGIWKDMPYVVRLAPEGWSKKQEEQATIIEYDTEVQSQGVKGNAKRSAWARLIKKVYGIDPLICEKCGSEMSIVAFIMDPEQIDRIIKHLKKQGRAPPYISITQSSTI
ncbi:MAG: transposase [Spirochaetes bacterium]|nr:transposase [Spirochaetota bacterium]